MNDSIDWIKIANCPIDIRKNLVSYINELLMLKHNFEKKGIYGLEQYINSDIDIFEKVALKLIAQGYMPELCKKTLYNILSTCELDNYTYLKYVIFTEFVLMLQKEENSDTCFQILLLSYLGMEEIYDFLKM